MIRQSQAGAGPALIRPMQPQDLAPVLQLTRLIAEAPEWGLEDFRKLVTQNAPAGPPAIPPAIPPAMTRFAWVAELKSHVLGLLVVQCLCFPSDPALSPECELESILVHPASRRLGLGQQLLATAVARCSVEGASVLRLEVRDSNHAAIHLYEKNGFERTGKRPGYYAHPAEDALLMRRVMDDSES